jgi:hypothetical protein
MKAKASGTPPKFAATPENVVSGPRIQRGAPGESAAYAVKTPMRPPRTAVMTLILTLWM